MQRVLAYGQWAATWWYNQVSHRSSVSPHIAEGLAAYAIEHAKHEVSCCHHWAAMWEPVQERARDALQSMKAGKEVVFEELEVEVELHLSDTGIEENDGL